MAGKGPLQRPWCCLLHCFPSLSQAGAVVMHTTHAVPRSAVPTLEELTYRQGLSGPEFAVRPPYAEMTLKPLREMRLWLLQLLNFCSVLQVPAGGITAIPADPSTDKPKQGGERLQEVHFPKPFLFNSRILSKMSRYSTSMRTRIKVSCTRHCLNSLIFWMMILLI